MFLVFVDPSVVDRTNWNGIEKWSLAARPACDDQTSIFQNFEMLHDAERVIAPSASSSFSVRPSL